MRVRPTLSNHVGVSDGSRDLNDVQQAEEASTKKPLAFVHK